MKLTPDLVYQGIGKFYKLNSFVCNILTVTFSTPSKKLVRIDTVLKKSFALFGKRLRNNLHRKKNYFEFLNKKVWDNIFCKALIMVAIDDIANI